MYLRMHPYKLMAMYFCNLCIISCLLATFAQYLRLVTKMNTFFALCT